MTKIHTYHRCALSESQRIHIARLLIIVAMALIGVYASLKPIRTVGADSGHKAAPPPVPLPVQPTLHGPAALKHLEQTDSQRRARNLIHK